MIRLLIAIRARFGRAGSAFPLRLRDSALSRQRALILSVREGEQFARVAKLLVVFALALACGRLSWSQPRWREEEGDGGATGSSGGAFVVRLGDASGIEIVRDTAHPILSFARVIIEKHVAELRLDLGEGRDVRDGEVGADDYLEASLFCAGEAHCSSEVGERVAVHEVADGCAFSAHPGRGGW